MISAAKKKLLDSPHFKTNIERRRERGGKPFFDVVCVFIKGNEEICAFRIFRIYFVED